MSLSSGLTIIVSTTNTPTPSTSSSVVERPTQVSSSSSSARITETITATATPSASTTTAPISNSKSLSPGTLAGLIIGGLFAGMILGVILWMVWVIIQRRRRRRPIVRTQPEERLRHLEMIRGQPAPPLREPATIQMLPPSKNIRILNWLARTTSVGSASQPASSESTHTHMSFVTSRDMVTRSDTVSLPSRHSQPSLYPFGSEAHTNVSIPIQQEQTAPVRKDAIRTNAHSYEPLDTNDDH